jgi:hypothetical protein
MDVVVAGWNHIKSAEGKRRSDEEVSFSVYRHMSEFGSNEGAGT